MIIQLNVGGTIFVTTKDTLMSQPSMLCSLIVHPNPAKQIDGAYFIDRDPQTFRWILNYLRGSQVLPLKNSPELMLLKEEAEYFAVDGLLSRIQHLSCPSFAVHDHVRVRGYKFTITHVNDDGYIVTRGGKSFKIQSSENVEPTTIAKGDVVMPYDKASHKRKRGICMGLYGKECSIQFDGDMGQQTCVMNGIRF